MKSLAEYLDCGKYGLRPQRDTGEFFVTKFSDITDKIIPFFNKYPIQGVKALDFADFCKVAELMKNKDHLNQAGLEQIKIIKAGMNRGRES
jgi:LAGLIDADG endonuclease